MIASSDHRLNCDSAACREKAAVFNPRTFSLPSPGNPNSKFLESADGASYNGFVFFSIPLSRAADSGAAVFERGLFCVLIAFVLADNTPVPMSISPTACFPSALSPIRRSNELAVGAGWDIRAGREGRGHGLGKMGP